MAELSAKQRLFLRSKGQDPDDFTFDAASNSFNQRPLPQAPAEGARGATASMSAKEFQEFRELPRDPFSGLFHVAGELLSKAKPDGEEQLPGVRAREGAQTAIVPGLSGAALHGLTKKGLESKGAAEFLGKIPRVGPFIKGAAQLASLVGGAVGGSVAQEQLASDDFKKVIQRSAEASSEGDLPSLVGRLAGSGLAIRPGVLPLKQAAGGLRAASRGNPLSSIQKEGLGNVAIGTVLGGGMSVAEDLTLTDSGLPDDAGFLPSLVGKIKNVEVNKTKLALETLGGAFFNTPTKLGQKLGGFSKVTQSDGIDPTFKLMEDIENLQRIRDDVGLKLREGQSVSEDKRIWIVNEDLRVRKELEALQDAKILMDDQRLNTKPEEDPTDILIRKEVKKRIALDKRITKEITEAQRLENIDPVKAEADRIARFEEAHQKLAEEANAVEAARLAELRAKEELSQAEIDEVLKITEEQRAAEAADLHPLQYSSQTALEVPADGSNPRADRIVRDVKKQMQKLKVQLTKPGANNSVKDAEARRLREIVAEELAEEASNVSNPALNLSRADILETPAVVDLTDRIKILRGQITVRAGRGESVAPFMEEVKRLEVQRDAFIKGQDADVQGGSQTETPEFKNFFGLSKVVDSDNNPLIVYHGTNKDFNIFTASTEGALGKGIYLTAKSGEASVYAGLDTIGGRRRGKTGQNVMPVYASVKNPLLVFRVKGQDPAVQALEALGVPKAKAMDIVEKAYEQHGNLKGEIQSRARKLGHDGILVRDEKFGMDEIVVFDKRQIKSATGNRGTFDPRNPDIRFQDAEGKPLSPEATEAAFAEMRAKADEATPPTTDAAGNPTPTLSASDRALQGELARLAHLRRFQDSDGKPLKPAEAQARMKAIVEAAEAAEAKAKLPVGDETQPTPVSRSGSHERFGAEEVDLRLRGLQPPAKAPAGQVRSTLRTAKENPQGPATDTQGNLVLSPGLLAIKAEVVAAARANPAAVTKDLVDSSPTLRDALLEDILKGQNPNNPKPTEAWIDLFQALFNKRGASLEARALSLTRPDGTPLNGAAFLRNNLGKALARIKLDAPLDTYPHELFHIFFADLTFSPDAGDRSLAARFLIETGNSKEFRNYNIDRVSKGKSPVDVEEFLTESVGLDTVRALLNTDKESPLHRILKDFWANAKVKYGNASQKEIQRLMSNRLLFDPSYKDTHVNSVEARGNLKEGDYDDIDNGLVTIDPETAKIAIEVKEQVANTPNAPKVKSSSFPGSSDPPAQKVNTLLRSVLDRVRNLGRRTSEHAFQKFTRNAFLRKAYEGSFGEVVIHDFQAVGLKDDFNLAQKVGLSKKHQSHYERINEYLIDMDTNGTSKIKLSAKEKKVAKISQDNYKAIRQTQIDKGLKIQLRNGESRDAGFRETYYPDIIQGEVLHAWRNDSTSALAVKTKELWITHAMAKDEDLIKIGAEQGVAKAREEATKLHLNYMKAVTNSSMSAKQANTDFNALRKAEGIGLPKELRETDLIKTLKSYSRRAARDLAFFETIQNDPIMRKAMGIADQNGKFDEGDVLFPNGEKAEDLMTIGDSKFTGSKQTPMEIASLIARAGVESSHPIAQAAARLFNAGILGPATGLRDIAQIPSQMAPFIAKQDLGLFASSVNRVTADLKRRAIKAGVVVSDQAAFEFGTSAHASTIADKMNTYSTFLRKWQGRDSLERAGRYYTFAIGEEVAKRQAIRASLGSKEAVKWFKDLGPELGEIDPMNVQPEDIQAIAGLMVRKVQGAYDETELVGIALKDSPYAPFLSLARWSLGKANRVHRDIWLPAKQSGNFMPLLSYSLGTLATGAAIHKMNELINNARGFEPGIDETLEHGDGMDIAYKVIALAQLGSLGGIFSDTVKMVADGARHGSVFKTPVNMPVASFLWDTGSTVLPQMFQAIKDDPDSSAEVVMMGIHELLDTSIQSYRIISDHTFGRDEAERKEKFRDKRVFDMLEGRSGGRPKIEANPFFQLQKRAFKRTDDIEEAREMLPELLRDAIRRSKGDPNRLKMELRGLKQNNFQTVPNPDTLPSEFFRYVTFLDKTRGEGAGAERVLEWVKQNEINKAKGSLVPSR